MTHTSTDLRPALVHDAFHRNARFLVVGTLLATAPAWAQNIFTIAGNGASGHSGDNGPAMSASLMQPVDVGGDADGNVFILDNLAKAVRRVTPAGTITTIATLPDSTGRGLAVGPDGTLFVSMASSLRRIPVDGAVTTFPETAAGLAFDKAGDLYMADPSHHRIRKLAASGTVTTVAGTGTAGFCGDGAAAAAACLNAPNDVAFGLDGVTLYIADTGNNRIRRIGYDGVIGSMYGTEAIHPYNLIGDVPDSAFFTEGAVASAVRWQTSWGPTYALAGTGTPGFSGDGNAASLAQLSDARGLFEGIGGNVFIADAGNHRVRRLRFGVRTTLVSDLGNDGKSDVIWRNRKTGANLAWDAASAQQQRTLATVTNPDWEIVGTGSFEGGNGADLLWRNRATGANAIWLAGNSATQQAITNVTNPAWKVVGIGDFDGNYRSDILWRNATTGQNVIWKGGLSTSQQPVAATANTNWQVAGVGHFWGDGKSDILWRNGATGANVIWRSGSATSAQAVAAVATDWRVAGIGDFDGDGRSDILWRKANGANAIWLAANATTPRAIATIAPAWAVAAIGDYDHDLKSDILWRNSTTGANSVWRSANAGASFTVATMPVPDWVPVR